MDLVKYLDKGIDRIFGTKHERDIKKMQPRDRGHQRQRTRSPGA